MRLQLFIVAGTALCVSVLAEQSAAAGSDESRIESGEAHAKWAQWGDAFVQKRGPSPNSAEIKPNAGIASAVDERDPHLVKKGETGENKEKWMQWSDGMVTKRSKKMA